MDNQEKICYWCGNTGVTWYDDKWGECVDHEYRNNEISVWAEAYKKLIEEKK